MISTGVEKRIRCTVYKCTSDDLISGEECIKRSED